SGGLRPPSADNNAYTSSRFHRDKDRCGRLGYDSWLTSNLMLALRLFIASRSNLAGSKLTPTAAFLELLAASAWARIVPPDFLLPLRLVGQSQARHRRQARLGPGHVGRLLAGQLFEGEQQHTRGVALKLLDPLPVFFLLGLSLSQPIIVLGEPFAHEGAGLQQRIPQPPALDIEFTAHKQSPGRLDALRGELREEGLGEDPLDHLIPLLF